MSARGAACALLVVLTAAAACAPLAPWQRGVLVSRPMRDRADALESGTERHVHETREGMAGATGIGGVSCGCN